MDIDTEDYSGRYRLLRQLHTCQHIWYHHCGNRGQSRILLLLLKYGECTQRELLDYAGIRSASLSELLCRMEAAGIITRDKCSDDKRNIRITLTREGLNMAERQRRDEIVEEEWLLSPLSHGEREQLSAILDKLCNHWITRMRPEDVDHVTKDDRSSLR